MPEDADTGSTEPAVDEPMADAPDTPESTFDPKPRIERWKRQLLDVSGRNRALFYRTTKQSLTVHEPEQRVWERLVDGGVVDANDPSLLPPSLDSTDGDAVDEARRDVERRLRSLAGAARTYLDEQGVHVLHACFGWLTWVDESRPPQGSQPAVTLASGRRARVVRSPLMFVPVSIERSRGGGLRLTLEPNVPVEPNYTLMHYMKHELGIAPEIDEEETEISPAIVVEAWRQAIGDRQHWSVELQDETYIDVFSFKKIALLREIEASLDRIVEQPLLRALCGDSALLEGLPSPREYRSLDDELRPDDVALVVPADSSQLRAVLAVVDRGNLVIQGPPGTGKSQTITNLIASLVARGKKVLFVAEKRAARDIVVRNLDGAGLGEIVLHITEEAQGGRTSAAAKRDIADQLSAILEQGPGEYTRQASAPERTSRIRDELNEYVRDLHEPLGPAAWSSPYRLLERAATVEAPIALDEVPGLPRAADVNDDWLEQALEAASLVDDLGEEALANARDPWLDTDRRSWDEADARELQSALERLAEAPAALDRLAERHGLASMYVGAGWSFGDATDLATLLRDLDNYARLRTSALRIVRPRYWRVRTAWRGYRALAGRDELRGDEAAGAAIADELREQCESAADIARSWYPAFSDSTSIVELAEEASRYQTDVDVMRSSLLARERAARAAPLGIEDALLELTRSRPPSRRVRDLLDAVLHVRWAGEAVQARASFGSEWPTRARRRESFHKADTAMRAHAVATTLNAVATERPGMTGIAPRGSEIGILRSQASAKRRRPLRWLFSHAPSAILRLKPCVVASPLAVAQFLHHPDYAFDVVIFDEASQIPTADAVVPISKARQVVVVGDSQQMPPTSFFDRALDTDTPSDDDDIEFESVLQECESLLPMRRLLWHYRSQDERLIAFSNQLFYNGELLTFPSSWAEHPDQGVHFEFVADAVYGRGGSRANPQEAERVVDLLEDELRTDAGTEVAVTAMSTAQGTELQERLNQRAVDSPILQEWIDQGNRVKNLETIQGDECDVMLLSFGYGRDAAGNLHLNFGPLSRQNGYRRLNVAVTRARRKMVLISSVRASEIPLGRLSAGGGQVVRQYLDYAERGPVALLEQLDVSGTSVYESPFEEEVASQLRARGWSVDTQVGVSRYRIDLAVRDPEAEGRYLAAVECDGATYHSAQSARDRDIVRQDVLERLQWKVSRLVPKPRRCARGSRSLPACAIRSRRRRCRGVSCRRDRLGSAARRRSIRCANTGAPERHVRVRAAPATAFRRRAACTRRRTRRLGGAAASRRVISSAPG